MSPGSPSGGEVMREGIDPHSWTRTNPRSEGFPEREELSDTRLNEPVPPTLDRSQAMEVVVDTGRATGGPRKLTLCSTLRRPGAPACGSRNALDGKSHQLDSPTLTSYR